MRVAIWISDVLINLTLWTIPTAALATALMLLAQMSAGKASADPTQPNLWIPCLANLSQVCRKFRVRELSLVGAKLARAGDEKEIELLVEFESDARVDYPAFLRLQADLCELAGRTVCLVHKRADGPVAPMVTGPEAQILYAAA
jgi:predicted nucleotidyltransferase